VTSAQQGLDIEHGTYGGGYQKKQRRRLEPSAGGVTRIHSPRRYEPVDIPAGTKVQAHMSGRVGVVQPHRPNLLGTFSVAWCDGSQLWEVVTADDVHVITETAAGAT